MLEPERTRRVKAAASITQVVEDEVVEDGGGLRDTGTIAGETKAAIQYSP